MEYTEPPRQGGADLHIHSHYSDGSLSPPEILDRAEQADLSAISLTDHDTVGGLSELMEVARHSDVHVVPGVELSCQVQGGRYHVLGYYIDWEKPDLVQELEYYEEQRALRVRRMIDVLEDHVDTEITYEDVAERSGRSLIGKPHVAQTLADFGIVDSVPDAFDEYLGNGMLLDEVPKERMGVREAIRAIRDAGGVPVLAHPVHYEDDLELQYFCNLGIRGLEVYYSDHSEEEKRYWHQEASGRGLLITGGSDFHGDVKPAIQLGDVRMPETYLDELRRVARQSGARTDAL